MRTLALVWGALLVISCRRGEEEAREDHVERREPGAPAAGEPDLLRIDPEMIRDLRITTADVEGRTAGDGVAVLGEMGVDEDAYAEVGSPVAARVVRVLAGPGEAVRAGQPLAELQSAELGRARAEHLAARARADLARQALARKRSLAAEGVASPREVEEAAAEAAAAEAAVRAARAALAAFGATALDPEGGEADAARLVLRSPVAGTVIERSVARGQVADPSRTLFRVADLARLWLTVHAFERDAVRVSPGAAARVSFAALPGRTFAGTVSLVGRQVDTASRTVPVRVVVANEDGALRPGMSATAWLPLGDAGSTVVSVPAASLQRLRDGWCVFVPRAEGAFEVRAVGRGRDLGGEVEVLSGLRPGEKVVVEGAFLLKAEADKARGAGEQHAH